jgi:hypothetical protein
VHLFRPSLSFRAEAQTRFENRRGQKAPKKVFCSIKEYLNHDFKGLILQLILKCNFIFHFL